MIQKAFDELFESKFGKIDQPQVLKDGLKEIMQTGFEFGLSIGIDSVYDNRVRDEMMKWLFEKYPIKMPV